MPPAGRSSHPSRKLAGRLVQPALPRLPLPTSKKKLKDDRAPSDVAAPTDQASAVEAPQPSVQGLESSQVDVTPGAVEAERPVVVEDGSLQPVDKSVPAGSLYPHVKLLHWLTHHLRGC
jgi:hypothetical protein